MRKVADMSTKELLQAVQRYEGQLTHLYQKRNQTQYLIDEMVEKRLQALRELEKRGIRNGRIKVIKNGEVLYQ